MVFRPIGIANAVLSNRSHLACNPTCENLAALFLAQAGAVEVTFDDEGDDIDDELVLVEDGVDNDRDHGGEKVAAENLNHNNDEATSLENCAVDFVSKR